MWTLESEKNRSAWLLTIDSFADFSEELADEALGKIKSTQVAPWDTLKCELWIDSGSIIIYPSLFNDQERNEQVVIKFQIRQLIEKYTSIEELLDESDDLFEKKYSSLLKHCAETFGKTLERSLLDNFEPLKSFIVLDPDMDVVYCNKS